MPKNAIQITIAVDGKGASAEISKTQKSIKSLGDTTIKASDNTKNLGSSVLSLNQALGALGLGALVAQTTQFVTSSFQAAAAAERLGTATENLASGIGSSGDAMVRAITSASLETISQTDAMQAANKALLFGLVENEDQMGELTNIAITLGAAMGQDASKSVDDLTTALGRQSPMILDNLGITLKMEEAHRIYAQELGKTVEALTEEEKKQAFVNAALIKGKEKVAELGGATLDNAGKVEQLSAAWADFQVAFGQLIAAMSGGIQTVTTFVRKLEEGATAWQGVFDNIQVIREWQAEQAKLQSQTIKTNGALGQYRQNIQAGIPIVEEAVQVTNDYTEATIASGLMALKEAEAQKEADSQIKARNASAERWAGLAEVNIQTLDELAGGHTMTTIEIENYVKSQEEAEKAEEERIEMIEKVREALMSLDLTQASYYNSFADLQDQALQSERSFNDSLTDIRTGAADKLKDHEANLTEELAQIETDRAEKLHWVMTGAHERTAEQNAEALAFWNTHYDTLKEDAVSKTQEKTDAIIAEQERAEGAAAAARARELADQEAHLNELKLKTALAMLETTGQLAQLTGLVGVSASEAASLITSGLLPVSNDLASAIQGQTTALQSGMDAAGQTATANQELIQQALDGTLQATGTANVALGTLGQAQATGVPPSIDEINTALSTTIPGNVNTTNESLSTIGMNEGMTQLSTTVDNLNLGFQNMSLVTLPAYSEAQVLMLDTIQPLWDTFLLSITNLDLALNNISLVTLPQLLASWTETTMQGISQTGVVSVSVTTLTGVINTATAAITSFGNFSEQALTKAEKGFEKAAKSIQDKLIPAMKNATNVAEKLADALERAARASRRASDTSVQSGGAAFQHGTPPGGFTVPSGFPNDSFLAKFTSGEKIFAFPQGQTPDFGGKSQSITKIYNFSQTVNTNATASTVIGDFRTMQLMAGK